MKGMKHLTEKKRVHGRKDILEENFVNLRYKEQFE